MYEFTEEEEAELRAIFDDMDTDKTGSLDAHELRTGAQQFGLNPTEAEVEAAKKAHDKNNDDVLNYEEFKLLMATLFKTPEDETQELEDALRVLLKGVQLDDNERITKDQFVELMQSKGEDPLTREEVDEIFEDLDKDGDTQTISKEELVALFTQRV